MKILETLLLGFAFPLAACQSAPFHEGHEEPRTPGICVVEGVVSLRGEAPAPIVVDLADDMRAATGETQHMLKQWIVSDEGALANCVVTLKPLGDTPKVELTPTEATFAKVGPEFVPRILLVDEGSTVIFRNENSPCRCFHTHARKNDAMNRLIQEGTEVAVSLDHAEKIRVVSDLRPYMQGYVVVTDQAHTTLTDDEGAFRFEVPPGTYRVSTWHEGSAQNPSGKLVLEPGGVAILELTVDAPTR